MKNQAVPRAVSMLCPGSDNSPTALKAPMVFLILSWDGLEDVPGLDLRSNIMLYPHCCQLTLDSGFPPSTAVQHFMLSSFLFWQKLKVID